MNQELRQAAERVIKTDESDWLDNEQYSSHGDIHDNWVPRREIVDAAKNISADYLRLTDPTPLTRGLLKQLGFVEIDGGRGHRLGRLEAFQHGTAWFWDGCRIVPSPRNAGELRQLAMRLEVELKEPQS